MHEHGRGLRRRRQHVDAHPGHADQAERRVVRGVPRSAVRDRRLQRVVADEQRREVRPGGQPLDARGGHGQSEEQLRHRDAGRHDISGGRVQRRHHRRPGGVLRRPDGRMVTVRGAASYRQRSGFGLKFLPSILVGGRRVPCCCCCWDR